MATTTDTNRALLHREIEQTFGRVPEWVKQLPDTALAGFWRVFSDFYLSDTLIPKKYKELIGIGVSAATHCRYCTLFHTESARLQGASDQEIAEASMMAGVTMMGSTFINGQQVDYGQFAKETREIVTWVRQQMASTRPVREHHARV